MKRIRLHILMLTACMLFPPACGDGGGEPAQTTDAPHTGTLTIAASGEDFVNLGFVSVDGWNLSFRHVWVTLENVEAHQTDPPFDPHGDGRIVPEETVGISGPVTVDLVSESGTVTVGEIADVPAGHYNAVSWDLVPALSGPSEGYSVLIDGQAWKGDASYNVLIGTEQGFRYLGGEYIGDTRKGIVEPGGSADLEITFHFDHIFGDAGLPEDDPLNTGAAGFAPFAHMMAEGTVETDLEGIRTALGDDFHDDLIGILKTLGHTGEGHCQCIVL